MSQEERKEEEEYLDMIPEDDRGDVLMLKMVLKSVTEFLREAKEPIEEMLKTLSVSLDGGKIGQDVAKFYTNLIEAGVPEDMAKQMTIEYFEKRLEAANVASRLISMIGNRRGKFEFSDLGKLVEKRVKEVNDLEEEDEEE
ncbi:MAG: hypothetical protein F7B59_07440 [Desulfurococcales archaeon]|nr:hypothetical protein [Desulfurococcales archaeon]